jgi:hypothetical protein
VHEVLLKAGKEAAFSGIFKHPPESTRQIMEPSTYLAHEKLPALPLPPLQDVLAKDYEKLESGSIGEFDCMTFIKQFGDADQAKAISTNWRGDYFYAATHAHTAQSNAARDSQNSGLKPDDISLLFTSRWASPSAARSFASFYGTTVPRRYPGAKPVSATSKPAQVDIWETSSGRVTVEVAGSLVVALESFDEASAARVRAAVLAADK